MLAKKIKRIISFILSFLLLFQGSIPYSLVAAQEATDSAEIIVESSPIPEPTPTPEAIIFSPTPEPTPVIDTVTPDWQTVDGAEVTTQPISEGHTYRYKDTAVSVTFTKVTQPELLKIKEVAVGDATGYDITSDMPDGTFMYNLTLPNPYPSQEAKVQYSEDGQSYQELAFEKHDTILVIKDLNHFTIFVVITNPAPPPAKALRGFVDNAEGPPAYSESGSGWVDVGGTCATNSYNGNSRRLPNTSSGTATWQFDVPSDGNYGIYSRWTYNTGRATNATYTINYEGGSDTQIKDQKTGTVCDSSGFQLLGTYSFKAGNTYSVILDNAGADGAVVADAIRIRSANLTNVYVDDGYTSGGVNDGHTWGLDAFSTIQNGVNAVASGGTVNIADGLYTTPTTIDKSGLFLTCAGTGAQITAGSSEIGIALLPGADNVTIENCLITGNGDGINLDSVTGVIIRNNTITNNSYSTSGIHILDSSAITITANTFSGNDIDISNDSTAEVTATGNDWGTFDGSEINDRIYDQLDDGSLGLVRYDADPPTVDAGPDITTNTSFNQTTSASDTYGIANQSWSQSSGPGTAVFDPFSADVDGTYVLRLTAEDYQGNSAFDEFTLVWDTTDPVDPTPTSSSHTIATWSNDRTIDVTWSGASDDTSGVDGYYTEWNRLVDSLLNSVSKEYEEDANSETSPNRSTAQDHYFHIATLDNAGNWTSTAHLGPFWIDAANPTGSWISPLGGAYLSGTVNLEVSASDVGSGVQQVTFRIRPTGGSYSNISIDTTSSYQTTLDTTTKLDGDYDLRGLVRDNSGRNNASTNAVISVTIDNTPPQTTIDSSPASLEAISSADFSFSADETATFQCQLDSGGFSACTSPVSYTSLSEGSHTFEVRATDQAGNTDPTPTSYTWTIDTLAPVVSWISPTNGQTVSGSVALSISATDATSGVATTEFFYQRQDGIDTFHSTPSPWDTAPLPLDNYTLRTVVTDTAGNATTVDQTVGVAAVISTEGGSTPAFGQITISWTTDRPTSGRIVYDTISHGILGAAPNYGYAFSTGTVDESPKSTSHTITITDLSDNTVYYWRTVSAGSPVAIGSEKTSRTFSYPGAGDGGGGGGAFAPAVAGAATAFPLLSFAPEVEFTPEETFLPSPTPVPVTITDPVTPIPEVKGTGTFNWWIVIIPAALLGLIISGLLLWRRP